MTNEEKFKEAWLTYLADDSTYNWQRWDKLRQVMFAMKKTPDEVEDLMNQAECKGKYAKPITPKTFAGKFPFSSATQDGDCEVVAQNVMRILQRTGDTFRKLTWEEYEKERKKDGNFTTREEGLFKKVVGYCETEEKARKFSSSWKEV